MAASASPHSLLAWTTSASRRPSRAAPAGSGSSAPTAHTALTATNIANEVDRYIVWPGQALAYKMGQLELLQLRAEARGVLAEQFDPRAFHDTVLGGGALPLGALAELVRGWIADGGGPSAYT